MQETGNIYEYEVKKLVALIIETVEDDVEFLNRIKKIEETPVFSRDEKIKIEEKSENSPTEK